MYVIPTFITEVLHFVTYCMYIFLNDHKSEFIAYTMLAYSYKIGFYDAFQL